MRNKPFTLVAAIIFATMALAHILRLFLKFQVVIGNHKLPMSASIAAIIVTGLLSWGLFREMRR